MSGDDIDALRNAVELGCERTLALTRFKDAERGLGDIDRVVLNIAEANAMVSWYQAGCPDEGPSLFVTAAIEDARAHVAASSAFAWLREAQP